jgi:SAM-dependent methyltransferase
MKIRDPKNRLTRFYGDVARSQDDELIGMITGHTVLDVGCGYGTLINRMRQKRPDLRTTGIDVDQDAIDGAMSTYGIKVEPISIYETGFSRGMFDTVILREAVHHLGEGNNLGRALNEINRICVKELIILDPNPNWLLRFCRLLASHEDPSMPLDTLLEALKKAGFKVVEKRWRDVVAFPLSGGFVGVEFVPNIDFVKKVVIYADRLFNAILRKIGIQKLFCWRYIVYAVKEMPL